MMRCSSRQYFFLVLPLTWWWWSWVGVMLEVLVVVGGVVAEVAMVLAVVVGSVESTVWMSQDLVEADVLAEGVDVLLPLLPAALHPGDQTLAHVRLAEAEAEVRHLGVVDEQYEDDGGGG